jgi:hypothetical protein
VEQSILVLQCSTNEIEKRLLDSMYRIKEKLHENHQSLEDLTSWYVAECTTPPLQPTAHCEVWDFDDKENTESSGQSSSSSDESKMQMIPYTRDKFIGKIM